ncbi:hypothetical protein DRP05_06325 [Archaeoglobales archaeon]|nr:MAG: hypothetical protein DRP05_06325 [Archaeoglobales archaeon]
MEKFPQLKKLEQPEASNRAIFFYGYQQEIGEDPDVYKLRDVDYFIRASQLRYSGMYFPALRNACFIILTHPPLLYDPRELARTLIQTKRTDREHNKINIYEDPTIYEEWLDLLEQNPKAIITTLSRPPKVVELQKRKIQSKFKF